MLLLKKQTVRKMQKKKNQPKPEAYAYITRLFLVQTTNAISAIN